MRLFSISIHCPIFSIVSQFGPIFYGRETWIICRVCDGWRVIVLCLIGGVSVLLKFACTDEIVDGISHFQLDNM